MRRHRLGILSRGAGWHEQDLLRAASERNLPVSILDFRELSTPVGRIAGYPSPLDHLDALLIRFMPAGSLEQIVFRMDFLHAAELAGLKILNSPRSVEACVDKYLTDLRLLRAGLPTIPTILCQRTSDAMAAYEALGGDVVVKPLFGSMGRGIVRVTDPDLAWRTFHAIEQTASVLYLQKFIPHAGWDLRLFVLAGRVLGAMQRDGGDDWRTNVARGGTTTAIVPGATEVDLALRAAAATGAEIAGVDLLQARTGEWYVVEVNAVPGWKALSATCGVDVAGAVLEHLAGGPS